VSPRSQTEEKIEYVLELSETVVGIRLGAFRMRGAFGAIGPPDITVALYAEEKLCEVTMFLTFIPDSKAGAEIPNSELYRRKEITGC
jgi:hypothetical protein